MLKHQTKIRLLVLLSFIVSVIAVFGIAVWRVSQFTFTSAASVITFPTSGSTVAGGSTISGTRGTDKPIQLFLDGATKPFYRTDSSGNSFSTVVPPTSCASHTITAQEYTDNTYATTSGSASTITVTVNATCGGVIQLGNFVWKDNNNNGINDESVAGINNVYLELYKDTNSNGVYDEGTDTFITGTTTASNGGFPGFYSFTSLANGNYFLKLPSSNFNTNGALVGMISSTGSTNQYEPAPAPDTDINNDDNGTQVGGVLGYTVTGQITLSSGTEPTNDGDASTNTNFDVDFGFVTMQKIGDYIWTDSNNNGLADDGVAGINGVVVNLYKDSNGNGTFDSGTDEYVTTTTTVSNGGFPGHYEFDNLLPGDYIVEIPSSNFASGGALQGKVSSTGANTYNTGPYETAPDPDNNVDNDDNGTQIGGPTGDVVSQAITITVGGEPSPGFGITNYNATLDFGFIPTLTLGNYIWNDANKNGLADDGVAGINNVQLNLYKDTNSNNVFDPGVDVFVTSTTSYTNAGFPGAYKFDGLYPGDYIVQIPKSNFDTNQPLYNKVSSVGAANAYEPAPDPDNDVNNDDNGTTYSNPNYGVVSDAITLTVGGEPTPGFGITNYNATLDFGFYIPTQPTADLLMSTGTIGRFKQGGKAGVSFVVANGYNAADATNPISMSSTLPSGLTFTNDPAVSPNWNCSKSSTSINCTYVGTYPVVVNQVLPAVEALVNVDTNAGSSLTIVGSTTTAGESSSYLANNSSARTVSVDPISYVSPYNASVLDNIPLRDANFNNLLTQNGPGWTGSDVAFSQVLPDGRVAWVFGDSYIGTSDPVTRIRSDSTMFIRNSMMIQNGNSMQTLVTGTINNPDALFQNPNPNNWYWPSDMFMEGGKLRVFLHEFTSSGASGDFNFVATGVNAIATIDPTTFTIESITQTVSNDGISWGLMINEDDPNFVYIYGNEDVSGTRYIHVARAPKGQVMNTTTWQFYDGSEWVNQDNGSAASRIIAASAASVIKVNNGYLMTAISPFSRTIDGYFSTTPYGPWGDKITLYNMPELQTGNRRYAYNPIIHPEFTDSSGMLLSYDLNTLGGDTSSDGYRPWFVRLNLSSILSSSSGGNTTSAASKASASSQTPTGNPPDSSNQSLTKAPEKFINTVKDTINKVPTAWRVQAVIGSSFVISSIVAGAFEIIRHNHHHIAATVSYIPKVVTPVRYLRPPPKT